MNHVTILHLSDLYFGMEAGGNIQATQLSQRNNTLTALEKTLAGLEEDWHSDIVVVSGDIGWKSREAEYEQAADWLRVNILQRRHLTAHDLIICPGNHDLDRGKTMGLLYPPSHGQADQWLAVENLAGYSKPSTSFHGHAGGVGWAVAHHSNFNL